MSQQERCRARPCGLFGSKQYPRGSAAAGSAGTAGATTGVIGGALGVDAHPAHETVVAASNTANPTASTVRRYLRTATHARRLGSLEGIEGENEKENSWASGLIDAVVMMPSSACLRPAKRKYTLHSDLRDGQKERGARECYVLCLPQVPPRFIFRPSPSRHASIMASARSGDFLPRRFISIFDSICT